MKKRLTAVLAGLLLIIGTTSVNAADVVIDQYLHRSNVVFVTDESGSMKETDPMNKRYEAIRLFLGEMADEGNHAGSVSFGEGIVDSNEIQPMNGQGSKDALYADISEQQYSDYTNIGLGLMEAVDMLDRGRNQEFDSAIILLTDGNTDMPSEEQKQESKDMKAEAIDRARKAGYKIFTICLNVNGAADVSEMSQIAEATGGEFVEVNNSNALNNVETMFNKLIFHSYEDLDMELVIGEDGSVKTDFDIPGAGIEEINVLFEGNLADCELVDPQGTHYVKGEGSAVVVDGADFLLMKVKNPIGGSWQAIAYGGSDTVIRMRLLYNSNFYATADVEAPEEVRVGDTVRVLAHIGTAEGIVYDTSKYTNMAAEAHILCAGEENAFPMQLTSEGFLYEMQVSDEGTYYITVSVANENNEEMKEVSDEIEISVNNLAPMPSSEQELSAHANIWPVIGGKASVDLEGAAVDPEGQTLTYSVESSAFNQDDYVLDGKKLTVNKFSVSKGSFTIRVTDPYGAYCTVDVTFTSTNIGLIMGILALVGIIAVVIVIILGIRAALGKALIGTLGVAFYDQTRKYPPQVRDYGRGQIPLGQFAVDTSSLPPGCKFQCDGAKRQIWFVSKKPVYSDNTISAAKKIRISGDGMEVRICSDEKMEKGIIVTFKSDKPDPMGMSY